MQKGRFDLRRRGYLENDVFWCKFGDDCDWIHCEYFVHRVRLHEACLCSDSSQCFKALLPCRF